MPLPVETFHRSRRSFFAESLLCHVRLHRETMAKGTGHHNNTSSKRSVCDNHGCGIVDLCENNRVCHSSSPYPIYSQSQVRLRKHPLLRQDKK